VLKIDAFLLQHTASDLLRNERLLEDVLFRALLAIAIRSISLYFDTYSLQRGISNKAGVMVRIGEIDDRMSK